MKRRMYIYAVICFCLILGFSFTWKDILERYEASYNSGVSAPLMKSYKILGGKYGFDLPQDWKLSQLPVEGGEILYHGDLISGDNRIRGLVQVWNINIPLKEFLEKSRFSSVGIVDIKNYSLRPYQTDSLRGYILTYSRTEGDNQIYASREYFIPANEKEFFRIGFYIKESELTEDLKKLFDEIASTLKIR